MSDTPNPDTRPPVAPKPGHWCLRRDGKAFRQDDGPDDEGDYIGSDCRIRAADGAFWRAPHDADCVGIIGPICEGCDCADERCVQGSPEPRSGCAAQEPDAGWIAAMHAAQDWRTIYGVRQAVVPLYGARPEFIRDDDRVRLHWRQDVWLRASDISATEWGKVPAVILRRRDDRNGEGEV